MEAKLHPGQVITDPQTGGLVFTNCRGQIIYASKSFLELLCFDRRQFILGKPLHNILRVTPEEIQPLLDDCQNGQRQTVVLEVKDQRGRRKSVELESFPTYDSIQRFVGINIIVKPINESTPADEHFPADPPSALIETIGREPAIDERVISGQCGTELRGYFEAQIDALQILMGRIGGLRVRDAMALIFNETAQKFLWPMAMVDGNIYIDPVAEDPMIYRVLLGELAKYAAVVIGWPSVAAEMRQVEMQYDTEIIDIAEETGLRIIYMAHLSE